MYKEFQPNNFLFPSANPFVVLRISLKAKRWQSLFAIVGSSRLQAYWIWSEKEGDMIGINIRKRTE